MARGQEGIVELPAADLARMVARLEALEHAERIRAEVAQGRNVIDHAWESWKVEAGRSAQERTQDAADRRFGKAAPRFRCRLDSSTPEGKPGPNVSEWPEIELSGNSDLEARARYMDLCGILRSDYPVRAEPVESAS